MKTASAPVIQTTDELAAELKQYVRENLNLSALSDSELYEAIEKTVIMRTENTSFSIEEKVEITESVYSSIRGLGVLDIIMKDEAVTEVMINGYDSIWIEKCSENWITVLKVMFILRIQYSV